MLTTAACPEASRNRRPSSAIIQQPSPRAAMGKVFLKLRGNSPLRVGIACPARDCSRVETRIRATDQVFRAAIPGYTQAERELRNLAKRILWPVSAWCSYLRMMASRIRADTVPYIVSSDAKFNCGSEAARSVPPIILYVAIHASLKRRSEETHK